jgi:multidrug resistance efflux pump
VLALLIGTSVLPPLVADQSDRAVVNAPVTLLTAPIAGDVEAISVQAGDRVKGGEVLAQIGNPRIDRTTAIQLDSRVADLRERALSAERKRLSNLAYVEALDKAIQQQSEVMAQILRRQADELKAKIASALASGAEKKVLMDRQADMVARNVASPDMVKSSAQAYTAAVHEKEAAEAKLAQKTAQIESLSKGIYAGDELNSLAELAQKRLAITYDAQRLGIEEAELKASLAEQRPLLNRENERLDSLTRTQIKSPRGGLIFSVGAAIGRHVTPGDSLAALVDCERAFVVAIFSYRQGQNLQVGNSVDIGTGAGGVRKGRVIEILPKTSDKLDAFYAVPFPQTERRELYVLVKQDPIEARGPDGMQSACDVGRWVTVTREGGWVPSTSVMWRTAEERITSFAKRAMETISQAPRQVLATADGLAADISGGSAPPRAKPSSEGSITPTLEKPTTPEPAPATLATTPAAAAPSPEATPSRAEETKPPVAEPRKETTSAGAPMPPRHPTSVSGDRGQVASPHSHRTADPAVIAYSRRVQR